MKKHKALYAMRVSLLSILAGSMILLGAGCNSERISESGTQAAKRTAGDSRQAKSSQQAAAVFDAQFHKLKNWNQMQPLSKWKGKYLVLNFWATWCKSCHHEVPELNKLYNQFKGKNTVVVGLAVDNADKVKDYVEQYSVDYPVLVGGDEALQLSKKMGNEIEGLPFTVMITPQGEVVETILGATEKGTLPKVLTPHLG
jgi:thiol-disulfide isomerase/thioredoxin